VDVQGLIIIWLRSPLFARAFPSDGNFASRFFFHALLRISSRPDDETDEVVVRILFDGNVYSFDLLGRSESWCKCFERRVCLDRFFQQLLALIHQLVAESVFPCIHSLSIGSIHRWR